MSGSTEWPGVMLLMSTYALAKSIHTYRRNPELSAAGGGLSVILSEAKDLMPVVSGDEILRFAQDDEGKKRLIPLVASARPVLRT